MPKDINQRYRELLQKAIARAEQRIRKIYEQSIVEVSLRASTVKLKDKPFSLSLYPLLDKQIGSTVDKMHQKIYNEIVQSVKKSWELSNKKNDEIVDKRFAGKKPGKKSRQIIYDPNKQAFDSFVNRKEKGMNLSDRVWNLIDPFKNELEQGLGLAVNKGQSAAKTARELKQYLNEPDRLFRRVRNEEGKLVLSKAARNYHPGRGVYRSSYKNALRLTRTENNISYRTADHERWKTMPFVLGIEIKLSGSHPTYDICDTLAGVYPKDFKHVGWHPQCLCYAVPKMMDADQYDKVEDAILAGEDFDNSDLLVKNPPPAFGQYVVQNKKRIEGWANTPYWVRDNQQYYNAAKPIKVEKIPTKGPSPSYDLDVLMNAKNEQFEFYMNRSNRIESLAKALPNLKKEELVSVEMYGNTSYRSVNQYLRDPEGFGESSYHDNFSKLLNSTLDKLPSYNGMVYRGGNFNSISLDNYANAFKSGKPLTEKAFTSTSKVPAQAFEGNTFFEIKSKNGKPIDHILEYGDADNILESEVLFKSNSRFRITEMKSRTMTDKWTGKKFKQTFIKMEEI